MEEVDHGSDNHDHRGENHIDDRNSMDLSTIIDTGSVSSQVLLYTGNAGEAGTVAAYAAWIAGVTGSAPNIKRIGREKRVAVVLTQDQIVKLRAWLDGQVGGMLAPKREPATVEYNLDTYLGPWALQYAVPLVLVALVGGWVGHWLIAGKRS